MVEQREVICGRFAGQQCRHAGDGLLHAGGVGQQLPERIANVLVRGTALGLNEVGIAVAVGAAGMNLDTADAIELAEMLQFLSDWLARDPARPLPRRVRRPPAYGISHLRGDLDRFTFLFGGNDGEPLFGPGQQYHPRPPHPGSFSAVR